MASVTLLSADALTLLRLHLAGESLQVGALDPQSLPGRTVEATRAAYRELVGAGLMESLHTFAHGRDSRHRLTRAGAEFSGLSSPISSLEGSASRPR